MKKKKNGETFLNNNPLKIINIKKIKGTYGIRVIPKCFFNEDI